MNIFYLSNNQKQCVSFYVDKHCVKMILEYAQILSSTHRYLDGIQGIVLSKNGRKLKSWILSDTREQILYKATHVNHPSVIWCRYSRNNYEWLYQLFIENCKEYTFRYGKTHACEKLIDALKTLPNNIPEGEFTEPSLAMPDIYKVDNDAIQSYINYYNGAKRNLFKWSGRPIPYFITDVDTSAN